MRDQFYILNKYLLLKLTYIRDKWSSQCR